MPSQVSSLDMSDLDRKAGSLSDEEEKGWRERFENSQLPSTGVHGVNETKDPRPKYNILSWLLFL